MLSKLLNKQICCYYQLAGCNEDYIMTWLCSILILSWCLVYTVIRLLRIAVSIASHQAVGQGDKSSRIALIGMYNNGTFDIPICS